MSIQRWIIPSSVSGTWLVLNMRPLWIVSSRPFRRCDCCDSEFHLWNEAHYPQQPRLELFRIRALHKTLQIINSHPNVQIRVGTGRLHCAGCSPLMSAVFWEHEPNLSPYNCLLCWRWDGERRGQLDILTRRQRGRRHSIPKIKTKYILIILTCQASCKNYSPWFEIPRNFILHFVLSMIVT